MKNLTEQTLVAKKIQGLLMQFTMTYSPKEILDQEHLKDNLQL